jgi:hypothetical protein
MGVGINYKGVGGNRHFDLNGVPTGEADALFKTPRRHKQLLPENFKKALHPQPVDPITKENEGKVKLNAFDMRPDTLDKKTMPGSAVITSMSGLCLEGEQENPSVVGTKLYGSHGGKKGYHAFDEFDPPIEGGRVGVLGAGDEGADDSVAKAGVPFGYQIASRVVMETDDLGRQILVEYDRDVQNTALGRTHTVTGERRRVVGVIDPNSNGNLIFPYQIVWDSSLQNNQGAWIIYLPEGSLIVDGKNVEVSKNLTNVGEGYPDWFFLESVSSDVYLNVKIHTEEDDQDESDPGVGEDEQEIEVEFSSSKGSEEDGYVLVPIKIAKIKEKTVSQIIYSAIILSSSQKATIVDGVSIDKKGGEDQKSLQLAHFSDNEKDEKTGLAARLKVDIDTGKVSAQGSDVMLVARKGDHIVYLPLDDGGEGDPDSPESGETNDPCSHPGGGDGVSEESSSTPDVGGGGIYDNGVPAGDDNVQEGVSDCC